MRKLIRYWLLSIPSTFVRRKWYDILLSYRHQLDFAISRVARHFSLLFFFLQNVLLGDSSKARNKFGWKPTVKFQVISFLLVSPVLFLRLTPRYVRVNVSVQLVSREEDSMYVSCVKIIVRIRMCTNVSIVF